ncbi:low molecular weight protein-tyrosine-phosphatase [Thomasclavelia sp.]
MIKIMFVCLGNICRSPMAEFVFKDLVKKQNLENKFYIQSAATSNEEYGNPVHPGTRNKLAQFNITTHGKTSIQLTKSDYNKYDYIIAMETSNIKGIYNIIQTDPLNKVSRLLDFTDSPRDIADPWYTGNFDKTYSDIYQGCNQLLDTLKTKYNL